MTNSIRHFSFFDRLCINVDQTLRTLTHHPLTTERTNPADIINEPSLSQTVKRHSAGLMRINHTGEVCAQALYQGQSITARSTILKEKMRQAAKEENDHLAWCKQRLHELNSHSSTLNPLFYSGALSLGIAAGLIGDQWNLGFLAETENQVVKHLKSHTDKLSAADTKSRAIIDQMIIDETQHEHLAISSGATILPETIKQFMRFFSKIMTTTTYWV